MGGKAGKAYVRYFSPGFSNDRIVIYLTVEINLLPLPVLKDPGFSQVSCFCIYSTGICTVPNRRALYTLEREIEDSQKYCSYLHVPFFPLREAEKL
jgi:hypothetical protein